MQTLNIAEVEELATQCGDPWSMPARAKRAAVVARLERVDRECGIAPAARRRFQDLLSRWGAHTVHAIDLPIDDTPYWLRGARPFANHRSRPELPANADIVIIGAGLTGAAAAYHAVQDAGSGLHVVVLDQGEPAGEASGRNGGNFELLPENSIGSYEGLGRERAAFLHRQYSALPQPIVDAEAERQASLVVGLSLRNRDLLKRIVLREQIDCDFAPHGWLHLACSEEEEQAICDEVLLAARHGQPVELWSRRRIRDELGTESAFLGRLVPGDGTYHPFKYVCGLLQAAVARGVELFTHVRVTEVQSADPDRHSVITTDGTIVARRVIAATNAFTSRLFPELCHIKPHASQIQVTEWAPDRARGRAITCEDGPVFFNQPIGSVRDGVGVVLMGGGPDRRVTTPDMRRRSRRVHERLLAIRARYFPELVGRPPSAEWSGTMAFTPDQLPAIGILRPGVVVAAGYNGYGGTFTTAAGLAAFQMARDGSAPEWVPEDVFSPRRFASAAPVFMTRHDGLWRIANSLCRQLQATNNQITETLALRAGGSPRRTRRTLTNVTQMLRVVAHDARSGSCIDANELLALRQFAEFASPELEHLLGLASCYSLPNRRVLYREGDPGDSCFILVRGQLDVSVKARGQRHLLGQVKPGTIFGQVSLATGEPRAETCSVRRDALLAQLDRAACERLLGSQSPAAFKFLAAFNEGLTEALRTANRRLMELSG